MVDDEKPLIYDEEHNNPCAELAELNLFIPQGANSEDFQLGAETRFGTMTVALEDQARHIEFGLSKAVLRLTLSGCRIGPGPRLFDKLPIREIATDVKRQKQSASTASGKSNLGASLQVSSSAKSAGEAKFGIDASAGVGSEKSEQTKQVHEESYVLTKQPILSVAGNRWEFSALGDQILVSKYTGDEPLCKVLVASKSFKIVAELYFFSKDIVLLDGEANGKRLLDIFSKSPNKAAISKILLAKNLRKLNDGSMGSSQLSGAIIGAQSLIIGKERSGND